MSDAVSAPFKRPGVRAYAERETAIETGFDRWAQGWIGQVMAFGPRLRAARLRSIAAATTRHEPALVDLTDRQLQDLIRQTRVELAALAGLEELTTNKAAPLFALIREASKRTLGLRHYDVQLIGAWAMLRGMVAEMRTGEGKTLCATVAAATAGLMSLPVHVITVNDYLAARDAAEMTPLYKFLGLTVGILQPDQQEGERQKIYACDIVYGSNKEMAFDYLRDRMLLRHQPGNLVHKVNRLAGGADVAHGRRMRGLHVALIDEGDSVLIDEARTPLIISAPSDDDQKAQDHALLSRAMAAADTLREGRDYRLDADSHLIDLKPAGQDRLEDLVNDTEIGGFAVQVIREHAVVQALSAQLLFQRDIHYILRDDKVQIVDENTGRVMPDRSWSEMLHQMVELKEGVPLSDRRATLARITYQRYFGRYRYVGAMTGTARDAAAELWSVYRLPVAKIPTNLPDARQFSRDRIFLREDRKWAAIAARVAALHERGTPVLLGTRSVAGSDVASQRLADLGVRHQVLSARQDADEAEIVAGAGQVGAVTVATNMAGRGTDIKLSDDARAKGGLHVILSERHDSRRIDRQLEGRCGRQGDPGHVEAVLSLQDELLRANNARSWRIVATVALTIVPMAAGAVIRHRQRRIEKLHGQMRRDLLKTDQGLGDRMAFTGGVE
jgi:preprotein translocase subunit SecA